MPTTVAQLRSFLDRFPGDAEVEVCVAKTGRWGDSTCAVPLNLDTYEDGLVAKETWDYVDWVTMAAKQNMTAFPITQATHPTIWGRRVLTLGET